MGFVVLMHALYASRILYLRILVISLVANNQRECLLSLANWDVKRIAQLLSFLVYIYCSHRLISTSIRCISVHPGPVLFRLLLLYHTYTRFCLEHVAVVSQIMILWCHGPRFSFIISSALWSDFRLALCCSRVLCLQKK